MTSHGTTTLSQSYRYVDAELVRTGAATVYYRLRQVDTDGAVAYSAVRTVALPAAGLVVQAYPVPARGTSVQLAVATPVAGAASLTVASVLGQVLLTRQVALAAGPNSLALPEAAQWPRGVYVLRLTQGSTYQTAKLVCE